MSPFEKGHTQGFKKGVVNYKRKTTKEKLIPFTSLPLVSEENSAEVLVRATNKIIDVYNKIAVSITDEDIVRMKGMDKINALQKLSFLNKSTEKIKASNMNFIKIVTKDKSAKQLEDALLNFDDQEEE